MTKNISFTLFNFLYENHMVNILNDLEKSTDSKDYFSLSITDKSKISYLKGDRIPEDKELCYCPLYRENKAYHTKIGKLLSDDISQQDKQKISAIMYNRNPTNDKLFLTTNICKYYLCDNYENTSGILGSSCMRSKSNQDSIKAYEIFGKNIVELLVLTNSNDKTKARALIWHNVNDNFSYMDRVYTNNDNLKQLFFGYAKDNNIAHNFDNLNNTLSIKICIDHDIALPYFDTFKYYDGAYINNVSGDYILESVDGNCLNNSGQAICDCCDLSFDYDEVGYSEFHEEYLCDECCVYSSAEDSMIRKNESVLIGDYYYHNQSEEICYCDIDNVYYLLNECVYSEHHNTYILEEDIVYSEYHGGYYHMDDVDNNIVYIDYKQDYFLIDDENIVEYNNKYYHIDETVYVNDNVYLLSDKNKIWYSKNGLVEIEILKYDNTIVVKKGELFNYTKDNINIKLVTHKSLHDDKLYATSELLSGVKVSNGYYSNTKDSLKSAIYELDELETKTIIDSINIALQKKNKHLITV